MSSLPSSLLSLASIRQLASLENLSEAYFNENSRVVSFVRGGETVERVRFNIYYTTGTVGTCVNHPRQGRTQLFRRNVTTAEELRAIFRNPRIHTGKGYQRRPSAQQQNSCKRARYSSEPFPVGSRVYVKGFTNATVETPILHDGRYDGKIRVRYDDNSIYHVRPDHLEAVMEEVLDEEEAAQQSLEQLVEERDDLDRRILEAQAVIDQVARRRKEEEARIAAEKALVELKLQQEREAQLRQAELSRIEAARSERGKCLAYCLDDSKFVGTCFSANDVVSIACGGNATIMLYEKGGWSFTVGLPKLLHNKLNGRQKHLPKPIYVAIGSLDRYYIRFADGKSEWVGSDALTKLLKNNTRKVATVAFGESFDSYFVVFEDGYWQYSGIPSALSDLLERRKRLSDLKCVSLGPNGEYFISAKNGRAWWGGLPNNAFKTASSIKGRIKFMDFGANDAFLMRYT